MGVPFQALYNRQIPQIDFAVAVPAQKRFAIRRKDRTAHPIAVAEGWNLQPLPASGIPQQEQIVCAAGSQPAPVLAEGGEECPARVCGQDGNGLFARGCLPHPHVPVETGRSQHRTVTAEGQPVNLLPMAQQRRRKQRAGLPLDQTDAGQISFPLGHGQYLCIGANL